MTGSGDCVMTRIIRRLGVFLNILCFNRRRITSSLQIFFESIKMEVHLSCHRSILNKLKKSVSHNAVKVIRGIEISQMGFQHCAGVTEA